MAEEGSLYVLDTFALVAHFEAELGGEKVRGLLKRAEGGEIFLAMSLMNMGELAYTIKRQQGMDKAQEVLEDLRAFPITFYEATEDRILARLGGSLGDGGFREVVVEVGGFHNV